MGKFFKTAKEYKPNPKLEAAVTSRVALEGSKDVKTKNIVKHYNKVVDVPYVGPRVKKEVIRNVKKKHGPFIQNTFGTVPDSTFNRLALTSIKKINNPNIKSVHKADSLRLVRSGQQYPDSVNQYFTHLKNKQRLKK